MKQLFLLRHAKSSWDDPTISDLERPLNKRGKNDSFLMANVFKQLNLVPELIISSNAKRAYSTAKRIASVLYDNKNSLIVDDELYDASVESFMSFINSLNDNFDKIMLVSHNPVITIITNKLTNTSITNMPTCGLALIEFNVSLWSEVKFNSGKLISFEYPKKYY